MNRMHMGRVLLASCVAIVGIGASATVAIGGSEAPAPVAATDLPQGLAAPAYIERAATTNPEFREFGVRPDDAISVPAPEAARTEQPWWVVPADHGACVSPGTGGLVCGTVAQLEAGQILLVELPLRPLSHPGPLVDAANPHRIAGLAPDGVNVVIATGADGREIGRSAVVANVYEIPLDSSRAHGSSPLKTVELRRKNGSVTALHVGG